MSRAHTRPALTVWFAGKHVRGVKGAFLIGPHDEALETVEYVPAEQLRGAVDLARMIVDTWGGKELHSETADLAVELAESVISSAGGQS